MVILWISSLNTLCCLSCSTISLYNCISNAITTPPIIIIINGCLIIIINHVLSHVSRDNPFQMLNETQLMSLVNISFQDLRNLPKQQSKASMVAVSLSRKRSRSTIKAELNPSPVINSGMSLFLGRFVLFNFQRENVSIAIVAGEKFGSWNF